MIIIITSKVKISDYGSKIYIFEKRQGEKKGGMFKQAETLSYSEKVDC